MGEWEMLMAVSQCWSSEMFKYQWSNQYIRLSIEKSTKYLLGLASVLINNDMLTDVAMPIHVLYTAKEGSGTLSIHCYCRDMYNSVWDSLKPKLIR